MITLLIISLLGLWIIKMRINRRQMYKLASLIPKPKDEISIIGLAHKFLGNMENTMDIIKKLSYESTEHNGILRCWLGPLLYFVITNPADMQFLLQSTLEKDDLHRFMRAALGNGIIFAPVNIWRTRRKFMVPAFSPRSLDSVVDILSNQSETLASVLESKANKKSFSVWPQLISYTFDSACESMAGIKSKALHNENRAVVESLQKLFELICERIFYLWLQPNWLYKFFPQYREFKKYLAIMNKFIDKLIEKVRTEMTRSNYTKAIENNSNRPFADVMINASGGINGYSNEELREELFSITAAATDTSAITIGSVLKLLSQYPEVQEKLHEELYKIFGNSDRLLEQKDLQKLPYMTCVIKETLRLFPPLPLITRKILEDVILPSGRVLPGGTSVVCSILGVHRDPKYWGPNAEHFDPDRFLPERFNLAHPCSFMPFSYGPRNCLGYQYGMISVKTALAAVLRRFRIIQGKEIGPIPVLKVKFDITMKASDGYQIALEKRIVHTQTSNISCTKCIT